MGEHQQGILFRPDFNRAVQAEASEAALSEDAGVIVLRHVADRLGVDDAVARHLVDRRSAAHITYSLPELVRTATFALAQGWRDQDDVDNLRGDVPFRVAVSDGRGAGVADQALASQPTMSRTVDMLADARNLAGLHRVVRQVAFADVRRLHGHRAEITVDVDSFPEVAHGHQEGAAYNGHYHDTCFHPIVAIVDGHMVDGRMRPGNAHTAEDVQGFVEPLLREARELADRVWLRFDAGFTAPEFMDWLDPRRVRYIARIRNNPVLQRAVAERVERQRAAWAASPSTDRREATFEFRYKAQKWKRERRIVAVLVERVDGDGTLFDYLFFLVTNVARPEAGSRALLQRYRARGCAENHIGELVNVVAPKVSSHVLAANEAVLLLGLLAYNLIHHVRRAIERHLGEGVSLGRVRERFLKAASVVVHHARRLIFRIGRPKVDAWRTLVASLIAGPVVGSQEGLAAN